VTTRQKQERLGASATCAHVDGLPWWWADASDNNTIDLAGVPPGEHKVLIELVDANHKIFPGQAKTVTFTVPGTASHAR
jgi:hypothetical protein